MADSIVTGEVRFSYANVFIPRANKDGQEEKYSITLLIPKADSKTFNALQAGIQQALQAGVSTTFAGKMPNQPAIPLYDGDGTRANGEPFGDEAKGHWVITASSKQKPEVVDANVQPIINQGELYSGCYGRASIRFFTYNKAGKKGVGCGLGNVQKLRDGEPLGGGTTAAEDFGTTSQFRAPAQAMSTYTAPIQATQPQFIPQTAPVPQIDPITGLPLQQYPTGGIMGI